MHFLLSLVNDMLDLKMMQGRVIEPKMAFFDPSETLQFIGKVFGHQTSLTKTEFSIHPVDSQCIANFRKVSSPETLGLKSVQLPEKLLGDNVRLKQILINLVKNAIKFTRRGKVQVLFAYH